MNNINPGGVVPALLVKDPDGPRTALGNPAQKSIYETRFLIEYLDEHFEGTKSLYHKQDEEVKERYQTLNKLIDRNEQLIEAFSFTHFLNINLPLNALLPLITMKQMKHMDSLSQNSSDQKLKKILAQKKEYKRA